MGVVGGKRADQLDQLNRVLTTTDSLSEGLNQSEEYVTHEQTEFATWGVRYLDDVTLGIGPNDLVVISAKTGRGKTQLAVELALKNAGLGKQVLFYSLESEPLEIERRIQYKIFVDEFYKTLPVRELGFVPNYPMFKAYRYQAVYRELKPAIDVRLKYTLDNLSTFYRGAKEFTHQDFKSHLELIHKNFDLIIVDHLQYFDRPDMSQSEIEAVQQIMKSIRDMTLSTGLPIVLLCHVRKSIGMQKHTVIPVLDDLYGHSDVSKVATKILFLAPGPTISPTRHTTYFHVAKYRDNGAVSKYVAECVWDSVKNEYEQDYRLGYISKNEFIPVEDKVQSPVLNQWDQGKNEL